MGLLAGAVSATALVVFTAGRGHAPAPVLFRASFSMTPQLVTNEFAHRHGAERGARESREWDVTSGSLFARMGVGWTGRPDTDSPGALSSEGTGSAVFRVVTKRAFGDSRISLRVRRLGRLEALAATSHPWDGIHIFARYLSPTSLYVVSIDRRDGRVTIKKKTPGAIEGQGTYHTLGERRGLPATAGDWRNLAVVVRTTSDATVTLELETDGRTVLTATDDGVGGGPITGAGRVGLRGDNTEFEFADFSVSGLPKPAG